MTDIVRFFIENKQNIKTKFRIADCQGELGREVSVEGKDTADFDVLLKPTALLLVSTDDGTHETEKSIDVSVDNYEMEIEGVSISYVIGQISCEVKGVFRTNV